jgi:hypothetical protein
MDGIMGAGPIGEMGRAVERATGNMSPDQKQEYLRQAALSGIDPRVNNIALLQVMSMQLDRLKQPQARPPQGGTVRQQLSQAVMMKDRQEQEAALRAQIAEAMQRRAAEQEMAMSQGVGGLDSGTMERAEYAGGGMIGYDVGGFITVPKPEEIAPSNPYMRDDDPRKNLYEYSNIAEDFMDRGSNILNKDNYHAVTDKEIFKDALQQFKDEPTFTQLRAIGSLVNPVIAVGNIGAAAGEKIYDRLKGIIGPRNPPGMANGGIVAFAGGGTPPKKTGLEALIEAQQKELEGGLEPSVARTMAAQEALRRTYGVGDDSEYNRAMQEELARMQEQAAGYGERVGREDLASYFFNVAAEAAKPGATFIGSYAKAAPGYAAARKQTQKESMQLQDQTRQARLKMLQAKDLERRGDIDGAFKLYHEGKKELNDAISKLEQIKSNREMVKAQMSPKGDALTIAEIAAKMARLDPTDPQYQILNQQFKDIKFGSAEIRSEGRMPDNIKLPYKAALDTVKALAAYPSTYPEKAKALQERDYWRNLAKSKGFDLAEAGDAESTPASTAPAPATGQAPAGGRYTGFNATRID